MAGVYDRKRKMVDGIVQVHLDKYHAAGDELIFGDGTFVAPRTVHVALREGGERMLTADRVFVNVGTHAAIPDTPGLREAKPMTHIEALDLQRRPEHLIVLGGGYVGLELGQALRRLGSRVTLIARGSQLATNEDADVAQAILQLFRDEGIDVLLGTHVLQRQRAFRRPRESSAPKRERYTDRGGNRHSRGAWTYAQHNGHRTRESGNRGLGKGTHPSERSPGNNRARTCGRWESARAAPTSRTYRRTTLSIVRRKPERRPAQHDGPAGSVLRLHRSGAGACWPQRVAGAGKKRCLPGCIRACSTPPGGPGPFRRDAGS